MRRYFAVYSIIMLFFFTNTYAQNEPWLEPLYKAIDEGDIKGVALQIKKGADVNVITERHGTPLMWAIYQENVDIVKFLLSKKADPNIKGILVFNTENQSYYGSPLAVACALGNMEVVKLLVENGVIDVNDPESSTSSEEKGWTPLQWAANEGKIFVIDYLLSKGANINLCYDNYKRSPLLLAVASNQNRAANFLLDNNADIFQEDNNNTNVMHYAIFYNNLEILPNLIKKGYNLNDTSLGYSYLMFAVRYSNLETVKKLVSLGADPTQTGKLFYQSGYFGNLTGIAAMLRKPEFIKYLIEDLKLDVNDGKYLGIEGLKPLHWAVIGGDSIIYKYLIDKGANLNADDQPDKGTPLRYALWFSHIDAALYLLRKDADPTIPDTNNQTPFYYSLISNQDTFATEILNLIKQGKSLSFKNNILFHQAVKSNNSIFIEKMMQMGLFTDLPDESGYRPIDYAIKNKNLELVELFLKNKASINSNKGIESPLCLAALNDFKIAQLLVTKGADVNQKSPSGSFPLFYAIKSKDSQTLNLLLSKGASVNTPNKSGQYPIHYAIKNNNLLAIKALIAAGADINQINRDGYNASGYAININADSAIIDFFIKPEINPFELVDKHLDWCFYNLAKKDPKIFNEKDSLGFPFIHKLVSKNKKEVLNNLAKSGINFNTTDLSGRTALYYSILIGNLDMAKELIRLNADVSKTTDIGDNALELALEMGYTELAQLLTSKGAKTRQNISVKPELYLSTGHTQGVAAIDISPDGKYMISFGYDNQVRLWEVISGKEINCYKNIYPIKLLEDNSYFRNSIKFSPDGNRFLVSGDETAEYDIRSGEKLRVFPSRGRSLYTADGNFVVTGGFYIETEKDNGFCTVFNELSGEIIFQFPTDDFNGMVEITPDNKYLVNNLTYQKISFWELSSGKEYKSIDIEGNIRSISISPDNKKIAVSYSASRLIVVYDVESGKLLYEIHHPGAIVKFSPDGKTIASGGYDQLVILWDAETGEKKMTLFGHDHYISSVSFSPDSKYVFTSSRDKTIIKWDVNSGEKVITYGGHSWQASKVSFSPDGKYIVSTGLDYSVKIWDISKSTSVNNLEGHKGALFGFSFSPDSVHVLTYGEDRIPRLWEISTGKRTMTFKTHDDLVLGSGFSPDGKYFFSYSNDARVILWEVATSKKILVAKQKYAINSARYLTSNQLPSELFCFTPDSKYLVSADTINTDNPILLFWDVTTGKVVKKISITTNSQRTDKAYVRFIKISPDGKSIICGYNYEVSNINYAEIQFFDIASLQPKFTFEYEGDFTTAYFSKDQKRMLVFDDYKSKISLYDLTSKTILKIIENHKNPIISPNGEYFMGFNKNTISLFNLETGNIFKAFSPHSSDILSVGFSPDGKQIISCSADNTIKITDIESSKTLTTLLQFDNNDWVTANPDGLFDASPQAMKLLYYVSGLEVIELDQMKERYFEPNLLPKLMGFNKEKVRNVETLSEVKMFPEVNVNISNTNLEIDLQNRGGGIGKVVVLVNGKEIASDARGQKPDANADKLNINLDLKNHPYLLDGKQNQVEVRAYNTEGYLVSRGATVSYTPAAGTTAKPPHLYVLACGVSDYTGDQIDLKYAAKDANDVVDALKLGGYRMFGEAQTHIYLMSTDNKDDLTQPTKANILKAFEEISKKTTSSDVFVLYLSGHGINWGGQDGDFYYLTKDAYTANIDAYGDSKIRAATTISSAELTDLFKKIPALKQVMMIDACASGKTVENLMANRDISASTLRALDRMKDRVGMYIITGCAADAVSYEASKFGQGLLTYSLLEGIKGLSLREDRFIDISLLLLHAQDRVPELAADIGGIQKPQIFSPYGSQSFDIGELVEEDKSKVTLAQPKPMFLLSVFNEEESMDDILGIEKMVDDAFRNFSSKGNNSLIFIQAKEFPDAYRLRGQYTISGDEISFRVNLFKGKEKTGSFIVTGNKNNLDALSKDLMTKALEMIKK